jgi:hypothetical protein
MTHAKVVPEIPWQTAPIKPGQVESIELFIVLNSHFNMGNFLPLHGHGLAAGSRCIFGALKKKNCESHKKCLKFKKLVPNHPLNKGF